MSTHLIAAIQMTSTMDLASNLIQAEKLIAKAAEKGARLVVLPEEFALFAQNGLQRLSYRENENDGFIQDTLAEIAYRYQIWLVGGTIPIASLTHPQKATASCFLWNDKGHCVARYDKIHLFDVQVADQQKNYCESEYTEAGLKVVVTDTPFGKIGLSVCYDLRFPELFRQQQLMGMEILIVPAAFTAVTGRAHWKILLQARAVENLCFVIAANQWGMHANGRETYGHSMIVSPWGEILAEKPEQAGIVLASIDLAEQQKIRHSFPVLTHRYL